MAKAKVGDWIKPKTGALSGSCLRVDFADQRDLHPGYMTTCANGFWYADEEYVVVDAPKPPPIGCMRDEHIDALKRDGRFVLNGETILYEALASKPALAPAAAVPPVEAAPEASPFRPVALSMPVPSGVTGNPTGFGPVDAGSTPASATTPAPEAKRPEWVKVTRLSNTYRHATVGKVYEVVRWNDDGSPDVRGDNGTDLSLSKPDGSDSRCWPTWEPATPPAPVPPVDPVREAFVKAARAYCAVNYLPTYDESRVRLHHAMIEAWGALARPTPPAGGE